MKVRRVEKRRQQLSVSQLGALTFMCKRVMVVTPHSPQVITGTGSWDRRMTLQEQGDTGQEEPGSLHKLMIVAFFPAWALTHSGDGSGEGLRPQDLAEKRPRPQKIWTEAQELLAGDLEQICLFTGKSRASLNSC